MSRFFYSSIALLAMTTSVMASSYSPALNFSNEFSNTFSSQNKIGIRINLGELNDLSEGKIYEKINEAMRSLPDSELDCTVTVTGSVSAGFVSVEVSVSVSSPCSEVKNKGKEIASQLLVDLKAEIKKKL